MYLIAIANFLSMAGMVSEFIFESTVGPCIQSESHHFNDFGDFQVGAKLGNRWKCCLPIN